MIFDIIGFAGNILLAHEFFKQMVFKKYHAWNCIGAIWFELCGFRIELRLSGQKIKEVGTVLLWGVRRFRWTRSRI